MRFRIPLVLVVACLVAACTVEAPERPAAVPSAAEPTGPPSPAPSPEPAPSAQPTVLPEIEEIAAEVSALRGLPVGGPIGARIVSDEELGDVLVRLEEEAAAEGDVLADEDAQRVLVALRLIDPDVDLAAVRETVLRQGVAGLYVPEEDVLYVGAAGAQLTPGAKVTAAHEVLHTLQDRAVDLERPGDPLLEENSDVAQAFTAVVEGDAVLVQEEWARAHLSDQERADRLAEEQREVQEAGADLGDIPTYLLDALSFPYVEGARFVTALRREGGTAAVDAALRDPPRSSAEILLPDRYLQGFTPADVPLPPAPGPDWEELDTDGFGVFDLSYLTTPEQGDGRVPAVLAARTELAADWAGGRLGVWTRGEDLAIGIAVRMANEASAARVCAAVGAWYEAASGAAPVAGEGLRQGDDDVLSLACEAADVRVGLAPDQPTAEALTAAP